MAIFAISFLLVYLLSFALNVAVSVKVRHISKRLDRLAEEAGGIDRSKKEMTWIEWQRRKHAAINSEESSQLLALAEAIFPTYILRFRIFVFVSFLGLLFCIYYEYLR